MIVIINYGLGNNGSILNMLRKVGCREAVISSKPEDILSATKLILPGVGHFDKGISNLADRGLIEPLKERVLEGKAPLLGICLGMQMLAKRSEEGAEKGLGLIKGDVRRFSFTDGQTLKIPHMGWNHVKFAKESPIAMGLEDDARFYFVHSYHLAFENEDDILTLTEYGYEFVSAVAHDNILGVQFHPEKSHKFGMKLLKNFVELI
ncbi:imidazole glycerol phosphate synthase subunit HisH [Candidatus Omnitrophota bacterium]